MPLNRMSSRRMEFLHALVGNLLEPRCKIAVLAVDDEIDRSLRVFQQKNEPANIQRVPGERQRQAKPESISGRFRSRTAVLYGDFIKACEVCSRDLKADERWF